MSHKDETSPSHFNDEPMQLDELIHEFLGNESSCNESNSVLVQHTEGQHENQHQVNSAPFEVEAYISQYSGYGKLNRLLYIADHCPSLRIDALEQALKYIKESTFNVRAYTRVHLKLMDAAIATRQASRVEPNDQEWIEKTTNMAQVYLDKLETDLKNYKTNSIKESIRRGHDDLGSHYLSCGDLQTALKCFLKSRDYSMGENHLFTMCINVLKMNIFMNNWTQVNSYIQKAEAADFNSTPSSQNKITCIAGLHDLVSRKYKSAALRFLSANIDELGPEFTDVMSPNNVTIYGGLCALATYDRVDLHKKVLASSSFKLFLELEPQLREAISKFYESKYPACLSLLDELRDAFMLDMYLAPQVSNLYNLIRNRALTQYFSPYLSADLRLMAAAFKTNLATLESELVQLILDGQIEGRIDSQAKILYAKENDPRLSTFEKALEMGRNWQMKATALVLRAASVRNGHIFVRPTGLTEDPIIATPSSPGKIRS